MGFWDVAKKVGGAVAKEAGSAMERSQQYRAEMPGKSDSQLMEIVAKELKKSPLRAGAARSELNNRYGDETASRMMQDYRANGPF